MSESLKTNAASVSGALLYKCIIEIARDEGPGRDTRNAYLLESLLPQMIDPIISEARSGTIPDWWRIEASGELLGYVLRYTAKSDAHRAYASGLLGTLQGETGALLPLVCGVLCNCDNTVSIDCEATLQSLLPLVLEELRDEHAGEDAAKRAWRTEALCSLVNKMAVSSPHVEDTLKKWREDTPGSVANGAKQGDVAAIRLTAWLAKACLARGHLAGQAFVDMLYELLNGEHGSKAAAAYAVIVRNLEVCMCVMYLYTYIPTYIHTYIHIFIYIYIYMYCVCVYIYIHTCVCYT
jgi:hypothetical protein